VALLCFLSPTNSLADAGSFLHDSRLETIQSLLPTTQRILISNHDIVPKISNAPIQFQRGKTRREYAPLRRSPSALHEIHYASKNAFKAICRLPPPPLCTHDRSTHLLQLIGSVRAFRCTTINSRRTEDTPLSHTHIVTFHGR